MHTPPPFDTTTGLWSAAARNITMQPGQRAVVLWDQMASNVMPWQALCERAGGRLAPVRRPDPHSDWTTAVLRELERVGTTLLATSQGAI